MANLQHLVLLRGIAIAGQLCAIGIATRFFQARLPVPQLLTLIFLLVVVNVATLLWLRNRTAVSALAFAAHLLIDVAVLTSLLYFTGGGANPFAGLFAVNVVIAAITLPPRYAWTVATVALACYTLLVFINMPLLGADNAPLPDHVIAAGTWLNFGLTAALITYFVVAIAVTARDQEKKLADAQAAAHNEETVLRVGALAANATHELSSPLSTMMVVVNELQRDERSHPAFRENLDILSQQLAACRTMLSNLMAAAGHMRIEGGGRIALDRFLRDVVEKCRLLHPGCRIGFEISTRRPVPEIVAEQILSQAILNLLNNAVDASPDSVRMDASWEADTLRVAITDRGAGLPTEALGKIGRTFFTTKRPGQGNGLGVMLANTTVRRFGGSVRIFNRPDGGACAEIFFPLAPLLAATPNEHATAG